MVVGFVEAILDTLCEAGFGGVERVKLEFYLLLRVQLMAHFDPFNPSRTMLTRYLDPLGL